MKSIQTVLAVAMLIPGPLLAQLPAGPADVGTIDGLMKAFYEVVSGPPGGRSDLQRDRSLHHDEAWIAIAGADAAGAPFVNVMTLDEFHGDNAPRQAGFWEWETDRVERRSGNMVSVWSSYASSETENGEPHTVGVNTLTLFWDGSRWWIMNWMFDSAAGRQ
jgi:hypothetical protein